MPRISKIEKFERLRKAFDWEFKAYLICNVLAVALLFALIVVEIVFVVRVPDEEHLAVRALGTIGSAFGAGGMVSYSTGRIISVFYKAVDIIFPQPPRK